MKHRYKDLMHVLRRTVELTVESSLNIFSLEVESISNDKYLQLIVNASNQLGLSSPS